MQPSIGRVVWVNMPVHSTQLCAALVAFVHNENCVNLAMFDRNGDTVPLTLVKFYHGDDGEIPVGSCGWMPYQVQAETKRTAGPSALERIDMLQLQLEHLKQQFELQQQLAKEATASKPHVSPSAAATRITQPVGAPPTGSGNITKP